MQHDPAPPPHRQITPGALVVTALLLVLLGIGGFLLVRGDSDEATQLAANPSPSPSAAAASPGVAPGAPDTPVATTTKTVAPRATSRGPVSALPAGLFCRDLLSQDYSYVAAVDYWRRHGQPNLMDADRNGIPCETVYSPKDVSAYWSVRELPAAAAIPETLPSGLLCRDLLVRGLDYADAVSYWWDEGAPDRMDVERNGIPCETVYPASDVAAYW